MMQHNDNKPLMTMTYTHYLFDWGNTLMEDLPGQTGPMALWPEVKAVPGAAELLRVLSQQGKCYIATNAQDSSSELILQALRRLGLDTFITGIFCYQEMGLKKTQPGYYNKIKECLNAPDASVVMIGDSLENDVQCAIDAGIDAIWFNRGNDACPEGVRSVTSLDQLLRLLK